MAAKLKKRALAEFSHVVTEEPQPVKKLRLIQKSTPPALFLNLSSASSSQEVIFLLLKLEENIPTDKERAESVCNELLEHYSSQRDAIVRCKVLSLLSKLAVVPGFHVQILADDLLGRLSSEKSHKVLSQLLTILKSLAQLLPSSSPSIQRFMATAITSLSNTNHQVRASSLDLIGCLASCHSQRKEEAGISDWPSNVQDLLTRYISDADPRVRCSAFEAMLTLHNSGQVLTQSVYIQACSALNDDYEGVRLAAIQLIWVLSHLYPESMVPVSDSTEELRLIDDGFAKICGMVVDVSLKVRVRASRLLGSLHLVSPKFLEQTLDKKIMSQLRRKRSAHERAREHFSSGEWSTGQKWADDAPKEDVDPNTVSLLSIGACGAFVHGLEDEYLEVRNATLDSLCELAFNSVPFAKLSLDSIIDMFNDEIESVRINAINSLRKFSHHLLLREDQVDIILSVLQDFSSTSREALRSLLGSMHVATKSGLNSCVMALLDNLRRYPQDKTSVWKCAQQLGSSHIAHTLALTPDLLCLHPYFDTPEPDMDDPAYITVLILVTNAASRSASMVPLLQEHTRRHYSYLRSSLPNLVPFIKGLETSDSSKTGTISKLPTDMEASQFLDELMLRLKSVESMDPASSVIVLECAVRDLETLKQLDTHVSSWADCTCNFLQSQLLMTKLLTQVSNPSQCISDTESAASAVDKILEYTTKLQTLFLGLNREVIWSVRQLELKAWTLHLAVTLARGSLGEKIRSCETFKLLINSLKKSLETEPTEPDAVTRHLLSNLSLIDSSHLQSTHNVVQATLGMMGPCTSVNMRGARKVVAELIEPVENQETAIKMAAGLTAGIGVVATVENITNFSDVRIQVKYPDQQTQLVTPPAAAWTRINSLRYKLVTEVVMSHALWSESCNVEISLVLEPYGQCRQILRKQDMVELSKPVKLLVSTKAFKR